MATYRAESPISLRQTTQISNNDHSVPTSISSTTIQLSDMETTTLIGSNDHNSSLSYDQSISSNRSPSGTLSFRNVKYILNEKGIRCRKYYPSCSNAKQSQVILNEISGNLTQGMNAIMGPTGCGKSSLLDALAGRKDPKGLSGEIFLNGSLLTSSFKRKIGYVVQDDILSGTLTVRENTMFSANIRLPSSLSLNERKQRVEKVIQELGLQLCADSRVGTEFSRGISGGERKRTCIGMELVLEPKILFLDEPTTGLDSSTAQDVMECLRRLSKSGRTIIFSIHQPRYSIFRLFDTVLLMCKGNIVYHGTSKEVVPYFTRQGYRCDSHENPADFALDILIEANKDQNKLSNLTQNYIQSSEYEKVLVDIREQLDENNYQRPVSEEKVLMKQSFGREIYYLSKRTFINTFRNPALVLSQIFIAMFMGLLAGLVFFDMKATIGGGVSNRFGAIFFIIASQVFGTVTALEPLLKERVLFLHEIVSGYYRILTFFLTKVLFDVLPMRIIPSIVFSLIVYFMAGFQLSVQQFLIFLATIFMSSVFGSAACFFISAVIPIFAVALIAVVIIFVTMMMFSDFIVELSSMFSWLSWIQWISVFRYASNILTINEFRNITFCVANMTSICPMTGIDILEGKKLDYKTDWDLWKNYLALSGMALMFFLFAFIQLVFMKKNK